MGIIASMVAIVGYALVAIGTVLILAIISLIKHIRRKMKERKQLQEQIAKAGNQPVAGQIVRTESTDKHNLRITLNRVQTLPTEQKIETSEKTTTSQ
ncbi:MAG: hypothetical protein C0178_06175 [Sulfurihydrogenibium sp.]|nr:MAG: hypothetical protein C0178_06175 [Sulfurihydrogenibium sp.]